MNGPAPKIVPQVNLDEFERRLRAAGAPAGAQEDPLDELARLVGLDGGAAKPTPDPTPAASPPAPPPPTRLPHIDEQNHDMSGFDRLLRIDFGDPRPEGQGAPPHDSHDDEATAQHDQPTAEVVATEAAPDQAAQWAADSPLPPRRSGRAKLAVGVLVGLGAAGLVGTWAVKGAPGLPKTPPMILAVDGPTKVQPPSQETVASPNDSVSMLLKDQTNKPAPVKLVSNEEQPVDLRQQTPPAPSDAAASAPAPVQQGAARGIAALATVAATAAPPAAPAPFPEPKRVKTVSVRPDGSLIANAAVQTVDAGPSVAPQDDARPSAPLAYAPPAGEAPVAATPAADTAPPSSATAPTAPVVAPVTAAPAASRSIAVAAPVDPAPTATATNVADSDGDLATPRPSDVPVPKARPSFGALAQPATPKLDLPPKPSAKSTARVPIAKIDTTVAGGSAPAPESPLQLVPNLLGSVARAVGGQPTTQVAAADPVATSMTAAAATAPATTAKADGAYAVQLAAPGSEQEAQSMSTRLQTKYTSELDGLQPTIHQADVNGRSIYRIRVSGLSKADAVALCLKLKAAGGDAACFVAKN
jgi:hypothetical protein